MLINAYNDIDTAINTGKTKHMEVGPHRIIMINEYIRIGSNSDVKVKTFKCLGSLVINQNSIHEKIKYSLKARNSCYYSVQTHLSSRLLSK